MKKIIYTLSIITIMSNISSAEIEHKNHKHKEENNHEHNESNIHNKDNDFGKREIIEVHEHNHELEDSNKAIRRHLGQNADIHDHEAEEKFGKDKAILEVKNNGKQFRLSAKAINTLKIESVKIKMVRGNIIHVPADSLVYFQDKVGIYIKEQDWFELIQVKVIYRGKQTIKIKSQELQKDGKHVVSNGVSFLRISHLEALGLGGKGHAH